MKAFELKENIINGSPYYACDNYIADFEGNLLISRKFLKNSDFIKNTTHKDLMEKMPYDKGETVLDFNKNYYILKHYPNDDKSYIQIEYNNEKIYYDLAFIKYFENIEPKITYTIQSVGRGYLLKLFKTKTDDFIGCFMNVVNI